jgi:hypothetical protein
MTYLQATKNYIARINANNTQTIKQYIDFSFAVHKDKKNHTRAIMTLGKGAIILGFTKQNATQEAQLKVKWLLQITQS